MPRFSIVTPVYNPPAEVLAAMLASVRAQTCSNWEHILVDDGSTAPHVRRILDDTARRDPRVRVSYRDANGGIVATSNDALALAGGEFIALLDHDDELHPDALARAEAEITAQPDVDYLYTDEDKIDTDGRYCHPFYKPDWSPERFRTQMYTCHLSVLRRELVDAVGGFDPRFEGSQDWDLALRVTEQARRVAHVPAVLYHWRMIETSTAAQGEAAKPYAYEAGRRAIEAHCERIGLDAEVSSDGTRPGVYHLEPRLRSKPLVSIIIPTRGTSRRVWGETRVLVERCVQSIVERSTYENYEIVCVYDAGTDPGLLQRLAAIAGERIVFVAYDRPFNFSEKVNLGAIYSDGDHLLLLNDDMEVITPDWLERLVMYSTLEGVGVVGAKLLFEDGRLQHVGVMCERGSPGHVYYGFGGDYDGYASTVRVAGNYTAVTGACLMTSRLVFERCGGLSGELPVNYNDIDYCLKVGAAGQRVVYDPDTVLYHFESSSRTPHTPHPNDVWLFRRWGRGARRDACDNPGFTQSIHMVPSVYLSDGTTISC